MGFIYQLGRLSKSRFVQNTSFGVIGENDLAATNCELNHGSTWSQWPFPPFSFSPIPFFNEQITNTRLAKTRPLVYQSYRPSNIYSLNSFALRFLRLLGRFIARGVVVLIANIR